MSGYNRPLKSDIMQRSNQKITKEKKRTFDWYIAIIMTAVIVLAVTEGWHFFKNRVSYQLGYQIEISSCKLEERFLIFKRAHPAIKVKILVVNRGLKAQNNVGLYIRFTKPIFLTYVPQEIPINNNKGESLIGNAEAFIGAKVAGLNMPTIPSGTKYPITFILDCEYSKEMKDKDKLIEYFELTSETK